MCRFFLQVKQPFLSPSATGITDEVVVAADYPVTGYDDRNIVFAIGCRSGPDRFGIAELFREFQVTDSGSVTNMHEFIPHFLLKCRAFLAERQFELPPLALEIFYQLFKALEQERRKCNTGFGGCAFNHILKSEFSNSFFSTANPQQSHR